MLLGYTGGDRAVRSRAQGVACGGARVRTDTTGVILLLLVVWIVEGSSGRSASGMAAGIWCSGVFLTTCDLRLDDPRGEVQKVSKSRVQVSPATALQQPGKCGKRAKKRTVQLREGNSSGHRY